MTTRGAGTPFRSPEAPQRATFLELFFDLAFVVALFELSHGLLRELRWSGAFQTLVLLLAVWWVWFVTVWLTDRLDPQRQSVQVVVLATLVGSLVMAAALPRAFDMGGGLGFAGAFVTIQIGRSLLLFAVPGGGLRRVALRPLLWAGVAALPWIAGALAHGTTRGVLWALAVAVEYTAFALGYPIPGLGRSYISESPVIAGHLAERYRQFLIVAVGGGASILSIATTVQLWRIYIFRAGELLSAAIAGVTKPGRVAEWASYAHLVMVIGGVVTAVGAELVITHPRERGHPAWVVVILGGPALFLVGRAILEYAVFARVSPDRLAGVLVLAALTPVMLHVSPLFIALAATVVLVGIGIRDAFRARGRPPEAPSPPGRSSRPGVG